jgi:protoporphyrinogen/coproporphyrinogen III oxidase
VAKLAVIGGGIAGLSVAFLRARAGDEVSLFEAGPTLGGQLVTERLDGFVVEHGAEGFVASSEAVATLAAELGIEASLVGQLVVRSLVFDGEKLESLERGAAAQLLGFQVPRRDLGQGVRTFAGGMGELVEALAAALAPVARVALRTPVQSIVRSGASLRLELPAGTVEAERVIVATNAVAAGHLLRAELGAPARELEAATTLSSVTVSLAYRREAFSHELAATGFVVAEGAQLEGFRACTFTSSKLPGRAPEDHVLLRAFFRPTAEELRALASAEWIARAERGIARALAPSEGSRRSWVTRWPDALPVFDAAHEARVGAVESALTGSGIALAGAAFHGSGIDAAVRAARRIAAQSV